MVTGGVRSWGARRRIFCCEWWEEVVSFEFPVQEVIREGCGVVVRAVGGSEDGVVVQEVFLVSFAGVEAYFKIKAVVRLQEGQEEGFNQRDRGWGGWSIHEARAFMCSDWAEKVLFFECKRKIYGSSALSVIIRVD